MKMNHWRTKVYKSFRKGDSNMTQKGKAIQLKQGAVTDMISHLANLPEREKSPDDSVSLPEVFRSKAYMAEIQGALKKGYTFEDLSEIFSEKCGVTVSVRQLKYHYTRGKNKPKRERLSSPKPPRQESVVTVKTAEKAPPNVTAVGVVEISRNREESLPKTSAKSGSFDMDFQQGEI
jgi:hypothetical protein